MPQPQSRPPFAIAIHGGAGTILKANMTPELEVAYLDGLRQSLAAGYDILDRGGAALDAVQAAVNVMEDSPLFNAGKGAVFTHEGVNEQDACIMDGRNLETGAVAVVRHVRNPINLARRVLEHSKHVLLAGEGAEAFARQHGVELVDPSYFHTDQRWQQLQRALDKEKEAGGEQSQLDHSDDNITRCNLHLIMTRLAWPICHVNIGLECSRSGVFGLFFPARDAGIRLQS